MSNTIIIIEYQSGLVEWMPSNAETLGHIVDSFDSIKSVSGVRGAMLQAEGLATDEGKNDKWWFAQLDAARKERDEAVEQRDEAVEKLRRAVCVLIGVGDGVNHES